MQIFLPFSSLASFLLAILPVKLALCQIPCLSQTIINHVLDSSPHPRRSNTECTGDRPRQSAMATTHADASLQRRHSVARSRLSPFLVSLSVLCGLVAFVVCLAAEASRAEAIRHGMSTQGNDGGETDSCEYGSGAGRPRLVYAVCGFLLLAVAMFAEHAYMILAVALPEHPTHASTLAQLPPPQDPTALFATSRTFTARAGFLYLATWICFAIAGVLLVVGIGVESGGLRPRSKPNQGCHVTRRGLFAAAGIFGLITVLLGVCLYLTALRMHWLRREEESERHRRTSPARCVAPHRHPFPPQCALQLVDQGEARGLHAAPERTSTSA